MSTQNITSYGNGYNVTLNNSTPGYIQVDPFVQLSSPNQGLPFPATPTITLSARRVSYQPNTLGNTVHEYSSVEYNDIILLSRYFADWQFAYDTQEGPIHTLRVQVPWDTISEADFSISLFASEQWELVHTAGQKSLVVNGLIIDPFQSPVNDNFVVFPDIIKTAIQQAYDNKQSIITLPGNLTGSIASFVPFLPYAQQILNYLRGGVEAVPNYTQTLKRTAVIDTRNINGAFQTAADIEQKIIGDNGIINYIVSTVDMISRYSIPATVAELMQGSYSRLLTVSGLEAAQYVAYAGWLVKPPNYQFITRNKVQLTQEFVWDEYLGGLYYIFSNYTQFLLKKVPGNNPNGFMPVRPP